MKISFKEISINQVDTIIEYMKQLYKNDNIPFNEDNSRTALMNLLNNDNYGKAFNITANGSSAGYLIITFGYSLEFKGKDALIDELFIAEESRGKGLGTEALKFAEKICKELGIKAIHLEVERENYKAQNVYRKSGFKDHNRYLMTKWI